MVVMCVIVRSTRRPCFNFRTYFHSLPVDPNEWSHSPISVVHLELCPVKWRTCCAMCSSYVFLSHSYIGEKKM